jgi:hypothetical protein
LPAADQPIGRVFWGHRRSVKKLKKVLAISDEQAMLWSLLDSLVAAKTW